MKYDDWFQTATGRVMLLPDFSPDEIWLEDIAHALALQCRFSGHCLNFYSVAEHSVRVSQLVPRADALWALMHDAAETYLSDIPAPFKRLLPEYQALEKRLMQAICVRFDLPEEAPPSVRKADLVMLATEKRDLLTSEPAEWKSLEGIIADCIEIDPWPWPEAKLRFLLEFYKLQSRSIR